MKFYKVGIATSMILGIMAVLMILLTTEFVQTRPKIIGRSKSVLDFADEKDTATELTEEMPEMAEEMPEIAEEMPTTADENIETAEETLYQRLQRLHQFIARATLHVRGVKTSKELGKATKLMNEIMDSFPKRAPLPWRTTVEPTSVCQEDHLKQKEDFTWFSVRNCTHAQPFEKLISIVMFIKDTNKTRLEHRLNTFLDSFTEEYRNVKVIMANSLNITPLAGINTNVKIISPSFKLSNIFKKDTDGDMWNMLVKEVTTPYVFVARDLEILNHDVRLDRLIREMETLQVPVASGAVRYPDGHWKMGCFQTAFRNFTLDYFEGYDESFHECVFCDFSVGPFLTTIDTLEKFPFAEMQEDAGLFEDWFLRLTRNSVETILCPDAMFNLYFRQEAEKWPQFVTKWNVFTVHSAGGRTITADCDGKLLANTATKALSPCLMEELFQHVSTLMEICENHTMICELNAGTLLGAIKMDHVLSWERDADINVLHHDFDPYRTLLSDKYKLTTYSSSCDLRFYSAIYKHWAVDVCERLDLESGQLIARGFKQTKVIFNGRWLAAPRNPGLFARNQYGREIFQHANHFRDTDTDPAAAYKTNRFLTCRTPNEHDCLDQYNGDGNLQFMYLMP